MDRLLDRYLDFTTTLFDKWLSRRNYWDLEDHLEALLLLKYSTCLEWFVELWVVVIRPVPHYRWALPLPLLALVSPSVYPSSLSVASPLSPSNPNTPPLSPVGRTGCRSPGPSTGWRCRADRAECGLRCSWLETVEGV